jgi:hypothetical protein
MTAMPVLGWPELGAFMRACRNATCKNARALGVSRIAIGREPCSWSVAMSTSDFRAQFRAVPSTPTRTRSPSLTTVMAVAEVAVGSHRREHGPARVSDSGSSRLARF